MVQDPGDFDPTSEEQVDRLVYLATRRWASGLRALPAADREEALADARSSAVIAALEHDPSDARTSKWKAASNRANYAVDAYLTARGRRVLDAEGGALPDVQSEGTPSHQLAQAPRPAFVVDGRVFDDEDEAEWALAEADKRWNRTVDRLREILPGADSMILDALLCPPGLPDRPVPTPRDLAARTGLTAANVRQKQSRLRELMRGLRAGEADAVAMLARLERRHSAR